jgi:hypothetical protein
MKRNATIQVEATILSNKLLSNEVVVQLVRVLLVFELDTNVTYYIDVNNEAQVTQFVDYKRTYYQKEYREVNITTVITNK